MNLTENLQNTDCIAGIDEAGRGALAGPVVAAAVIFREDFDLIGLDDSKKLTANERYALASEIKEFALGYGIGFAWQKMIDKENILQATLIAMTRATQALYVRSKLKPNKLLIDGKQTIPPMYFKLFTKDFHEAPLQNAIIEGDSKVPEISAASILAKTTRDDLMIQFAKRYPQYQFEKHFGYGSKVHRDAILEHKPCPLHRMTFRGVKEEENKQLSLFDL